MRIIMGREMEGRLEAKSTTRGSLPGLKAPPARAVGALTDCADGRRTVGGRGALRKGRVPAHCPSSFSSVHIGTTSEVKAWCVSYIDPLHRSMCGTKVNIRYRGCPIRLGRANQPEFCLSPHQSRLLLVDSAHTINRGREDERVGQKGRSRAHPFGKKTKYCTANQPSTNCFSPFEKPTLLNP